MTFQLMVWGSLSTLKLRTVLVPGPGWPCSRVMPVQYKEAQSLGLSVDSSLFYSQALCLLRYPFSGM